MERKPSAASYGPRHGGRAGPTRSGVADHRAELAQADTTSGRATLGLVDHPLKLWLARRMELTPVTHFWFNLEDMSTWQV